MPATRKPFLKRKRSTDGKPLIDIAHNARIKPVSQSGKRTKLPVAQMQIDLGGEIRKTCAQCGMEYIPSNCEDAALHREFHNMHNAGIEVGKMKAKRLISPGKPLQDGEAILMVDRRSCISSRERIKKIMGVVDLELSAAPIEDDHLWSSKSAHFKAFVFLVEDRCVGACLIERITLGYRVVEPSAENTKVAEVSPNAPSSSISVAEKAEAALLGVTRIWTLKAFRGNGIAG